MNEFMMT